MDLGFGEYINLSLCVKAPYDCNSIKNCLDYLLSKDVEFGIFEGVDISPDKATYQALWEGKDSFSEIYSEKLIDNFFLSSLDVHFKSMDVYSRINIYYLDENSYEFSLYWNYENLIEKSLLLENSESLFYFIEQLMLSFSNIFNPLYALIGIEKSVAGFDEFNSGCTLLPTDKVFYNFELIRDLQKFHSLVKNVEFLEIVDKKGIYFRRSLITQFDLQEDEYLVSELCNIFQFD